MALRESGSPSLRVHSEAPHDYWAEFDAPSHDHPTLQRAAWVVLFFPLFAAFAAPVLYLLYALGFI